MQNPNKYPSPTTCFHMYDTHLSVPLLVSAAVMISLWFHFICSCSQWICPHQTFRQSSNHNRVVKQEELFQVCVVLEVKVTFFFPTGDAVWVTVGALLRPGSVWNTLISTQDWQQCYKWRHPVLWCEKSDVQASLPKNFWLEVDYASQGRRVLRYNVIFFHLFNCK